MNFLTALYPFLHVIVLVVVVSYWIGTFFKRQFSDTLQKYFTHDLGTASALFPIVGFGLDLLPGHVTHLYPLLGYLWILIWCICNIQVHLSNFRNKIPEMRKSKLED